MSNSQTEAMSDAKTLEQGAVVRFLTTSEIDNEARGHCDNSDALRIQDFIAGADYVRSEYEPELHSLLAAAAARYDEAISLLRECEDADGDEWLTFTLRKVRAFLADEGRK